MTLPVAAIIVTADSQELVARCLAALPAGELETVVVVDNASSDGTAEAIRRTRPDVELVRTPAPLGFAPANNLGTRRVRAELLLFLNSDVVAAPGAVGALVAELARRPEAVAAGGRLVDPGTDTTQVAYRPRTLPGIAALALQLTGLARLWPGNPVTAQHLGVRLDDATVTPVEQPAGACLLVRRSAYEAVGGFDDRYWFWYEDVDLCRRLLQRGEILYVPAARFEHLGGASFARWDRDAIVRARHDGLLRYVRGWSAPRRTVLALVLVLVSIGRALTAPRAYLEVLLAALELPAGAEGRATRHLAARARGATAEAT